ncbi:aryl-alcohol dehydrogenase [Tremella mesenterica]|uniref:Aryl-alcohol dehydrogenase n=1 Tax=Tremella mesenterica TaxID=5217 RepID=A0A4Q1BSX7_TREME|nr:aryl-alcohol dehydrogenase [Tremella mesenterica]
MPSFGTKPTQTSADDFTPAAKDGRMVFGTPLPDPKTELGVYRLLSPSAGVKVSPICLGAMSLGDQWVGYMGSGVNLEKSLELLDAYYEAGGNFIDTANNYQDEQSEMIVGEWMEKRGVRDDIVLATKYTTFMLDRKESKYDGIRVNYGGNSKKSLVLSVEGSLKKLRTTYIDLLYVHWWDYSTSIPELMQSLNDLVRSGKVLYLGVSDTPAWIVSQANEYARQHGLAQFVVYQGQWSLADRDLEREIVPMARANGMSIAPWGVFGGGMFRTAEEFKARENSLRGGQKPSEKQLQVSKVLEEIAKEIGENVKLTSVALAWIRQRVTDCFPILGGTSIENFKANVEALKITLTEEQMQKLDEVSPCDYGFPYALFGRDPHYLPGGKPNSILVNAVS